MFLPKLAHPIDYSEHLFQQVKENYRIEPKYDGIRLIAISDDSGVHFYTRSQRDITAKLLYLKEEMLLLPVNTMLDGELILKTDSKREELGNIQKIIGSSPERANRIIDEIGKPIYQVFDVLWYDGQAVHKLSLADRINFFFEFDGLADHIKYVKRLQEADITKAFQQILSENGEGIVVKDLRKSYSESFWLRKKGVNTIDLTVTGFYPAGGRYSGKEMVGSLKGCLYDDHTKTLSKVANIYGMSDDERRYFYQVFTKNPEVQIICECKYSHRFPSGGFRFCSFLRIREDK
ncbi:MAG: ATP-dependent DNA ligase [Fibrobacteres bacterium]|nr:ATP-dependent DNA ligase [Fibrobacterota bacterium]